MFQPDDAVLVILCSWPTEDPALDLCVRGAVERGLAACVQRGQPVRSVYRWEGQIEEGWEIPLTFKLSPTGEEALREWVFRQHPYAVPEWIVLGPARASASYGAWVRESTKRPAAE